MEKKGFCNGQIIGWLVRFTANGAGLYTSEHVPDGLPAQLRIKATFAHQIQTTQCLETVDSRMISGLMPIRGTMLFQADTVSNGERSLLIVNVQANGLQIVYFEDIPPFLWNRARTEGVEWFTGKKKTYTTGRKSFSTTKSTKRGFGNRCG